jgi:type VI secretion system protein ImpJ
MGSHSLNWGDGLFLQPHHFQQQDRLQQELLRRTVTSLQPYAEGLFVLELDRDALANWRISLTRCQARLPDGTMLRFPEDCHISPVMIPRSLFRSPDSRVMVFLGISELRRGESAVSGDTDGPPPRYRVHREEAEDENRAGNPQEIEFRRLNPGILIGQESSAGYCSVPLLRLRLGASAEAPPEIDPEYFPPVLHQEAWPPLVELARSAYDRLGAQADREARQMIDRGVAFSSGQREDFERILRLQALNAALGGLAPLPFERNLHPHAIYREFCRAAGQLALFRRERRLAELPLYDHYDLAGCLRRVFQLLQLDEDADPDYSRIAFAWQGQQMAVRLRPEWVEPVWSFYIGVESTLSSSKVVDFLSARRLDLKVASSEQVEQIFQQAARGLQLRQAQDVPRVFPRQDWHYFRVERNEAWGPVEKTLNLGIRFNDKMSERVSSSQNAVDVLDREANRMEQLSFSLFAIRS